MTVAASEMMITHKLVNSLSMEGLQTNRVDLIPEDLRLVVVCVCVVRGLSFLEQYTLQLMKEHSF